MLICLVSSMPLKLLSTSGGKFHTQSHNRSVEKEKLSANLRLIHRAMLHLLLQSCSPVCSSRSCSASSPSALISSSADRRRGHFSVALKPVTNHFAELNITLTDNAPSQSLYLSEGCDNTIYFIIWFFFFADQQFSLNYFSAGHTDCKLNFFTMPSNKQG